MPKGKKSPKKPGHDHWWVLQRTTYDEKTGKTQYFYRCGCGAVRIEDFPLPRRRV